MSNGDDPAAIIDGIADAQDAFEHAGFGQPTFEEDIDSDEDWTTQLTKACQLIDGALAALESHTEEIRWSHDGTGVDHEYALFARNGFAQSVREAAADRDDLQLFDLEQIVAPSASQ